MGNLEGHVFNLDVRPALMTRVVSSSCFSFHLIHDKRHATQTAFGYLIFNSANFAVDDLRRIRAGVSDKSGILTFRIFVGFTTCST